MKVIRLKRHQIYIAFLLVILFTGLLNVSSNVLAYQIPADGVYTVPVSLWHASKDQASMGNQSLYQTGKLVIEDGSAVLYLKFEGMEFSGMSGYLMQLDLMEDIELNEFDYPDKYSNIPVDVLSTYGIIDEFNKPDSEDINCAGKEYPKVVSLPVEPGKEFTWAHVYVPVMGSLGFGDQVCRIKISYGQLKEITDKDKELWTEFETDDTEVTKDEKTTKDTEGYEVISEEETAKDNIQKESGTEQTEGIGEGKEKVKTDVLKERLKAAKLLLKKEKEYTEASLSKLKAVAAEAEKALLNTDITQTAVNAQISKLQAAMDAVVKKTEEKLDKDKLADGKYSVYVDLWHASADKASMGNPAFNTEALLTVEQGIYNLEISTRPMTVGTITACLQTLQIKQEDGSYIYADITARNNEGGQPSIFLLRLPKKAEYIDVLIDPKVEVMGEEPLPARLKISWDTLVSQGMEATVKENTKATATGLTTQAVDKTDDSTGIRIVAEANILPEGTTIKVTEAVSGKEYEAAVKLVERENNKPVLYSITLVDEEGLEIQPSGMVKVSIPVPLEFDDKHTVVYRIESGNKIRLSGTLESGSYSFATNRFGLFAVAETGDETVVNSQGNISVTTDPPSDVQEATSTDDTGYNTSLADREVMPKEASAAEELTRMFLGLSMVCSFVFTVTVILVIVKNKGWGRNYES